MAKADGDDGGTDGMGDRGVGAPMVVAAGDAALVQVGKDGMGLGRSVHEACR